MNYIKRCEGEPEETLAIFDGDVYVTKFLKYEHRTPSENPLDRWRTKDGHDNMYRNDDKAITHFADSMKHRADRQPMEGDFQIIRKAPDVMLAMRRIVFNNDHQPKDLTAEGIRRWQMGNGWTGDDQQAPKVFTITPQGAEAPAWLTYAHLLGEKQYKKRLEEQVEAERQAFPRPPATPDKEQAAQYEAGKKMLDEIDRKEYFNVVGEFRFVDDRRLISNVMGYNTGEGDGNQDPTGHYWVSDLMLDLTVKVESGQGSFILELSKGIDRFRATFDVATGECVLQRRTGSTEEEQAKNTTELGRAPTALKAKGTYHVRFANFDERLTVWVDRKLPFGDGVEYPPAQDRKPTKTNDLAAPASVGATGASVSVSHLQLWRDTFYTHMSAAQRPKVFGEFRDVETMYVQPGHYLCLGDNSGSSADSRDWGLVPDRLLLGRALWVYFPFWPFNNRFGPIR